MISKNLGSPIGLNSRPCHCHLASCWPCERKVMRQRARSRRSSAYCCHAPMLWRKPAENRLRPKRLSSQIASKRSMASPLTTLDSTEASLLLALVHSQPLHLISPLALLHPSLWRTRRGRSQQPSNHLLPLIQLLTFKIFRPWPGRLLAS